MTPAQEVARWAAKAREATTRRDDAIRRMRDEGAAFRDIAEAAGMSHPGIMKIVDKALPAAKPKGRKGKGTAAHAGPTDAEVRQAVKMLQAELEAKAPAIAAILADEAKP